MENIYQTKYGSLKAMDLVGVKYGSKVQLSKGYGYALHPTPELWTKCLPHRFEVFCYIIEPAFNLMIMDHDLGHKYCTALTLPWFVSSWSCDPAA